uniref:Secreted phosphoprotein 1 n=1 Tax=Steinernema glaseri TaxID=37863 RepID=A0A1I7YKX8_9BILA
MFGSTTSLFLFLFLVGCVGAQDLTSTQAYDGLSTPETAPDTKRDVEMTTPSEEGTPGKRHAGSEQPIDTPEDSVTTPSTVEEVVKRQAENESVSENDEPIVEEEGASTAAMAKRDVEDEDNANEVSEDDAVAKREAQEEDVAETETTLSDDARETREASTVDAEPSRSRRYVAPDSKYSE